VSLINKMLRDLDERQASTVERAGLVNQVRALPPERRFPWSRVLLLLAGVALGVLGLGFLLNSQGWTSSAPVAAPITAPVLPSGAVPSPASLAMTVPALVVPMPGEEREALVSTPYASLQAASVASLASLQLDVRLSQPAPVRNEAAKPGDVVGHGLAIAEADPATIDKRPHEVPPGNSAEAEYRKAMAAFRQGRSSEALAAFQNVLRIDSHHVAARQAMLSLLMEQRRWLEAQTLATEGLAFDAAQPGWAMILARLQVEQGQVAEAQETMARHAAYGERNPDYRAFHALILQKLQRPKEAVEHFRAAAGLRPNEGRWWYGLGLALEADQRPQEAREAFRQARDAGNLPAELAAAIDQRLR
jgi:MSHA biogenesis protein MshN